MANRIDSFLEANSDGEPITFGRDSQWKEKPLKQPVHILAFSRGDLNRLFVELYDKIMNENIGHTDIRGGRAPIPQSHIRRAFEAFGVSLPTNGND